MCRSGGACPRLSDDSLACMNLASAGQVVEGLPPVYDIFVLCSLDDHHDHKVYA
jgi:hypothetical protein